MSKHMKLVRDRIPEIIEEKGGQAFYRLLDDDADFIAELENKLLEEAQEFLLADSKEERIEEMGDMVEVMRGLMMAYGIEPVEVEGARLIKKRRRGGFVRRIYLIESTDK